MWKVILATYILFITNRGTKLKYTNINEETNTIG